MSVDASFPSLVFQLQLEIHNIPKIKAAQVYECKQPPEERHVRYYSLWHSINILLKVYQHFFSYVFAFLGILSKSVVGSMSHANINKTKYIILTKNKTGVYVCETRMGFEKWKFMVKQCGMLYGKQKASQITDCILCVLRREIIQLVI